MTDEINNKVENITPDKKKDSTFVVSVREIIGGLFWVYLIIKIFIYDIDIFFLNKINPHWTFLLNYKFFILLGLLIIVWLIIGNKEFYKLLATIIFFPIIFLLWRIPKLFWKSKSWIGVFSSLGIIITFFNSIKVNLITFALVSTSVLFISVSNNQALLVISISILFLYLVYHYAKKFRYAFKPSNIFTMQSDAINKFWDTIKKNLTLAEDIRATEYDNMSISQKEKWSNNLQFLIVLNRILYFITTKVRKFQKSSLNVAYYFLNLFYTVILTVLIFAFQNFALFKINLNSFNTNPKGNFFFFIYYSFNTLFTQSVNDFYPISDSARFLNSFETLFSFMLLAILFFLLTTIVRDKHNEEISTAIISINSKSKELENVINEEYRMDINQAIKVIESLQGNLIKIIYYFSQDIDDKSV